MLCIDEITRKAVPKRYIKLAYYKVTQEFGLMGYFYDLPNDQFVSVLFKHKGNYQDIQIYLPAFKGQYMFSNMFGRYVLLDGLSEEDIVAHTTVMSNGQFPYSFARRYEAVENFYLFKDKQEIKRRSSNKIARYLDFTIGLEFETSQGYVPEELCFRDGLIPLRDGSISGLEYSTVVLQGNKGINLLKQQLKTLNKYTTFNKECSLHMHFGNYPLEPDALWRLHVVFNNCVNDIRDYVPQQTFDSDQYKANGKNYCRIMETQPNFDKLYYKLVGRKFFGDLTQPHPDDEERERKWQIHTRYYALNFINAICYNVNKTIEFRFLRPTYNYNKILLWIYIFNAMLKYAIKHTEIKPHQYLSIHAILRDIYPEDLSKELIKGLTNLHNLKIMQENNQDYCGRDFYLEDRLFKGKVKY